MLLNSAIPNQSKRMAKKGDQREIFAVLPISPQVANEITTITHQGKTICSRKEAISITIKTIVLFFGYF
jgi:hypothetical protein